MPRWLLAGFLLLAACDPKGACEVEDVGGTGWTCGDRGNRALCDQAKGTFSPDKKCGELGYACDDEGVNCAKK